MRNMGNAQQEYQTSPRIKPYGQENKKQNVLPLKTTFETIVKPRSTQKLTHKVILSTQHSQRYLSNAIKVEDKVFNVQYQQSLNPEELLMSGMAKQYLYEMQDLPQSCKIQKHDFRSEDELQTIQIYLYYNSRLNEAKKQFSKASLCQEFSRLFERDYFNNGQTIPFKYGPFNFDARIVLPLCPQGYGFISSKTIIQFFPEPYQNFKLVSYKPKDQIEDQRIEEDLQTNGVNYRQKLHLIKAGGLSAQIDKIVRRVFATRKYGGLLVEKLGINHAKGILLFGPPGTGKTLLAREMAKVLDVKPTVINGPDILDKFVGEGERKLREIFTPAIQQYNLKGNQSSLHVIIFDEIDSIARKRGSSDSSIGDSLVNQLLTLIDGVQSPNNILIIGMTNRKDLIDDALLRSGRLEVHIQIYLPSQDGRREIFDIHLRKMKAEGTLSDDVSPLQLSKLTKNFTGAQIQSLVKSAATFAIQECQLSGKHIKYLKIQMGHFKKALSRGDVFPQFGQDEKELENLIPASEISIDKYIPEAKKIIDVWTQRCSSMQQGKLNLLIKGPPRSGKTTLAAKICRLIDLPFSKFVTCDKIYSLNQTQKIQYLVKTLEDSKRCSQSCIILDDLLRLFEFAPLGSKYNNNLLQLILNIIQSASEKGKKKVIIATCDSVAALDELGITKLFSSIVQMRYFRQQEAREILCSRNLVINEIYSGSDQLIGLDQISEIMKKRKSQSRIL